jgi:signal transduction histidine kinase/ActR/RegA family two-component response regulator
VSSRKRLSPLAAAHPGRLQRWWLDRSVRVKGTIVVAAPLIALLGVTVASLILQANEHEERQQGQYASSVSSAANQILTDVLNAETGVRGYAVNGDPSFLVPYTMTLQRMGPDLAKLRTAAVAEGDRRQEQALETTETQAMAQLAQMRSAIGHGELGRALSPQLVAGKQTVDLLRNQVTNLASASSVDLAARRTAISQMESAINLVTIAGLVLGMLAGVIGVALFTSGISGRVAAAAVNADRLGEGQDLVPVPDAGDELGRLSKSLARAQELLTSRAAELITARDEALTATHAKNAFLSSTSHELRTPLNAVLGFTQLLQLSELAEEDRDSVERILSAGRHLLALINELIDIARIESGEFSLSVEPVLVPPLVEETCQLMGPLAAQRGIKLSQHCDHPGLSVRADRQRLSQILVNLASNAVKYNRKGGSLTITCQPDGPHRATLVVADTGPGIAPDDLERIFIPFERLGAEQTAIEGTGIGLPLARAFTEAMSGQLAASSVVGEGSTFTITLPRAADMLQIPAQAGSGTARGSEDAADDDHEGITRVLYIEDNPANIEVVSRFLRSWPGVRLQSVMSGQTGLEIAIRDLPDLLLLDLHLPDLSGDQVLRQLHALPTTASIPVVILSAEAAPSIIRDMRSRGVIAYLTKPLDLAELGRVIDAFLAGRAQETGSAGTPGAVSA